LADLHCFTDHFGSGFPARLAAPAPQACWKPTAIIAAAVATQSQDRKSAWSYCTTTLLAQADEVIE
jgi:hypothetical protein